MCGWVIEGHRNVVAHVRDHAFLIERPLFVMCIARLSAIDGINGDTSSPSRIFVVVGHGGTNTKA